MFRLFNKHLQQEGKQSVLQVMLSLKTFMEDL